MLRMLLPPIAALLVLGALVAYYPSIEPATAAYDQGLVDVGISLGSYLRASGSTYRLELPAAVATEDQDGETDAISLGSACLLEPARCPRRHGSFP